MSALGGPFYHHECCASTNDEAARLGRLGSPHGTVVSAAGQERGRGRQGHAWYSPPGENLYLSVLLRPPLPPAAAPLLTLCAGVAVAEAVAAAMGAGEAHPALPGEGGGASAEPPLIELKWPNDVLLGGRKVAGILTEMSCTAGQVDFVVVGIGVNLDTLDFPPELADRATSLRKETGRAMEPAAFREGLLRLLGRWYETYLHEGAAAVIAGVARHAAFLRRQQPLCVQLGDRALRGWPVGLGEDGALLLRDEAGVVHRVISGEVTVAA